MLGLQAGDLRHEMLSIRFETNHNILQWPSRMWTGYTEKPGEVQACTHNSIGHCWLDPLRSLISTSTLVGATLTVYEVTLYNNHTPGFCRTNHPINK